MDEKVYIEMGNLKDIIRQLVELYSEMTDEYNIYSDRLRNYVEDEDKGLHAQVKREIDELFYSRYKPDIYNRSFDLHNTFEFYIDSDLTFDYDFGPQYMQNYHRASNEWIYENSFQKGWHGGSIKDNDDSVRYWRKPHPYYKYWGREAVGEGYNIEETIKKYTEECYMDFEFNLSIMLNDLLYKFNLLIKDAIKIVNRINQLL